MHGYGQLALKIPLCMRKEKLSFFRMKEVLRIIYHWVIPNLCFLLFVAAECLLIYGIFKWFKAI